MVHTVQFITSAQLNEAVKGWIRKKKTEQNVQLPAKIRFNCKID